MLEKYQVVGQAGEYRNSVLKKIIEPGGSLHIKNAPIENIKICKATHK